MNDRYLQYELSHFLTDDSFINWVLDGTQNEEWLLWLDANPSRADLIKEAKETISQLRFVNAAIPSDLKNNLWKRIDASTQAREIKIESNRRQRIYYVLVAAAVITLLALFFIPDSTVSHSTQQTMAESITLPDKSVVTLSPSSKILYKEKSWAKARSIDLIGKGHFKVSKGVPFTVKTENGSVQVLGTEFDVVSVRDVFKVLVTEGKVNVSSGNHNRILTAGMAFYKNPEWEGEHSLNDTWKVNNMFFSYREESLFEILKAIKFNYNIEIDYSAIDTSVRYTGYFESTDDLRLTLERILWVLKIDFTLSGDQLVLSPQ